MEMYRKARAGKRRVAGKVYTHEELREMVLPILSQYGMASAGLFGSYARNEATPESDIDLLVFGKPGFRLTDVFGVAEELYEASGKRVDVFEAGELLPGSFRDTVMTELVML